MVCAPVRRDNPRALARGLSTVQDGVSRVKDWVSLDCGTMCFSARNHLRQLTDFCILILWKLISDLITEFRSNLQLYGRPKASAIALLIKRWRWYMILETDVAEGTLN